VISLRWENRKVALESDGSALWAVSSAGESFDVRFR